MPVAQIPRRELLAGGLLALAVTEAVLDEGGFKPGSRVIFAGLAAAALAAAFAADPAAVRRAGKTPVALALWSLAGLGAVSALWTVGVVGDSLRWGAVTFGYGAVFVSTASIAGRRGGTRAIAVGICALATVSGMFGIAGAAGFAGPFADYTAGTWRPGGTLEYSAAICLLAVSALPIILAGMCGDSRRVGAAAAFCGAVGAVVLGLGDSRAEVAFAGLVCLMAIAFPGRTLRTQRPRAIGAVGTLGAVAIGAHTVAGGRVGGHASPHIARTLIELAMLGLLACIAWVALTRRPSRPGSGAAITRPSAGLAVAVIAAVIVAVAAGVNVASPAAGQGRGGMASAHRPPPRNAGGAFWHGRIRLWRQAIETAAERPLFGAGADAFLVATIVRQHSSPVRFAHDLPLELAVELGIPGLGLSIFLYGAAARSLWRSRGSRAGWLLVPAGAGFLAASLVDWPWHLAGSGAVWAAALGGAAAAGRKTVPTRRRREALLK